MSYEILYHIMFNTITDAIWSIDGGKPCISKSPDLLAKSSEKCYS